jgi:putative flippase GtrA
VILPLRWFALPPLPRFVVAGALNTVATWALYLALLPFLDYVASYSVAYVAGIGLGYVLNARLVFRTPLSRRGLMRMPLVYLAQYLLGTTMLWVAVSHLGIDRRAALPISIAASVPVTFLLSRALLVGTARSPAGETAINLRAPQESPTTATRSHQRAAR